MNYWASSAAPNRNLPRRAANSHRELTLQAYAPAWIVVRADMSRCTSALGHFQTSSRFKLMSVSPPKAEILRRPKVASAKGQKHCVHSKGPLDPVYSAHAGAAGALQR